MPYIDAVIFTKWEKDAEGTNVPNAIDEIFAWAVANDEYLPEGQSGIGPFGRVPIAALVLQITEQRPEARVGVGSESGVEHNTGAVGFVGLQPRDSQRTSEGSIGRPKSRVYSGGLTRYFGSSIEFG